ncbi:MAG TPA: acyl-CoA dehydrogenase family protein [Blastocatellia bacterium]|nr:acyl-CoA dehydrogenase family protein [Blastocatellia bacterium]
MDFDLSKPQQLLQQSAREFFSRECPAERVRALMETDTAFDGKLWEAIADQGWTGLVIPEEFGGLGLSVVELAVIAEEMGRAVLPGPFISTTWAAAVIAQAGSEGQRAHYLEAISTGKMKATVAMLESTADWNPEAVQMKAERAGKNYRLSGRKEFVTDAGVADLILCVARDGADLVLLPVSRRAEGVNVIATPGIDATRKLYAVEFEGVTVSMDEALELGRQAKDALDHGTGVATIALCAEMLGGMQWVLETAVEYVRTRQQFGRPVGVYQAVQHQCADMLLATESSRSAVYYAAWALSENDPSARLAVSIAKSYCSDAAREVGNRGIQVHGGIGFTWEHNLHLYYKRAKASEIMFGDATYHREQIAREVVDEPESF